MLLLVVLLMCLKVCEQTLTCQLCAFGESALIDELIVDHCHDVIMAGLKEPDLLPSNNVCPVLRSTASSQMAIASCCKRICISSEMERDLPWSPWPT